jgi:hypothetical protein
MMSSKIDLFILILKADSTKLDHLLPVYRFDHFPIAIHPTSQAFQTSPSDILKP